MVPLPQITSSFSLYLPLLCPFLSGHHALPRSHQCSPHCPHLRQCSLASCWERNLTASSHFSPIWSSCPFLNCFSFGYICPYLCFCCFECNYSVHFSPEWKNLFVFLVDSLKTGISSWSFFPSSLLSCWLKSRCVQSILPIYTCGAYNFHRHLRLLN